MCFDDVERLANRFRPSAMAGAREGAAAEEARAHSSLTKPSQSPERKPSSGKTWQENQTHLPSQQSHTASAAHIKLHGSRRGSRRQLSPFTLDTATTEP
jgi:hypothetical protein